jgi:hypothetical protein
MTDMRNRNFQKEAAQIQDASNIVAITGVLRDAMIGAREQNHEPRADKAVLAIFFKVYDMLGAPSESQMYEALKYCEASPEK